MHIYSESDRSTFLFEVSHEGQPLDLSEHGDSIHCLSKGTLLPNQMEDYVYAYRATRSETELKIMLSAGYRTVMSD